MASSQALLLHPSAMLGSTINQQNQIKPYLYLLGGEVDEVASSGDVQAYVAALSPVTDASVGQQSFYGAPAVSYTQQMLTTPILKVSAKVVLDIDDEARAARFNFSDTDTKRASQIAGIANAQAVLCLFGYDATSGILNSPFVTATNLPADSTGNVNVSTYNAADMNQYLLNVIMSISQATYMNVKEVCIYTTSRIMGMFQSKIVSVTANQMPGAGTQNIINSVKRNALESGITVHIGADDNLLNKGTGGNTDLILITPTVMGSTADLSRMVSPQFNTNAFGMNTQNNLRFNTMVSGGTLQRDTSLETNNVSVVTASISPGWTIRNGGAVKISAAY